MLIINADDLGRDKLATNACIECFRRKRITSASIMVFMHDSNRAAELALKENLETGLHLNLVLPYDSPAISEKMKMSHTSAVRFFKMGPWTQVIYNPFIINSVAWAFHSQLEEYRRLFGKAPVHFNGHKHFHLSLNVLFGKVLPVGSVVRRHFTYSKGEKSLLNIFYRRIVDAWLKRRYLTTDSFFSLGSEDDLCRLRGIVSLAQYTNVELMVHPWRLKESAFLAGKEFENLIAKVHMGGFASLKPNEKSRFWPVADHHT